MVPCFFICYFMAAFFLYLMSMLYVAVGINHFWHPRAYFRIIPHYLPYPEALVAISGVCEILFGLMLLYPPFRGFGAWVIIVLLIAVFPANIQMAVDWYYEGHSYWWVAWLRLPLQLLLIRWAWLYTRPLLS
jgi:uncharacterized membrane protein